MTSSVIAMSADLDRGRHDPPRNRASRFRKQASEAARLCPATPDCRPASRRQARITSARLSGSAALTLKKTACRPACSISFTTFSAFGSVALRSRWTPTMLKPLHARALHAAAPNPLDAPRISAHFCRDSGDTPNPTSLSDSNGCHSIESRGALQSEDACRDPSVRGGADPYRLIRGMRGPLRGDVRLRGRTKSFSGFSRPGI